jgi:maltooligosyltrehalose trehalohydrolase
VGKFQVWAPAVKQVELQVAGARLPMTPDGRGSWVIEISQNQAAADYAFFLDGEGPFPDPRSPCQPEGVHGSSRPVDHGQFPWTDADWRPPPISSAVIYELHVGTFTPEGTYQAVVARLGHLTDLGVTHVELMPVNEFSGSRGWGYDGVDLFAPYHAYGSPDHLKRLVDACHARGLAVLLDVVYNHLGPSGNYLAKFGPYFTPRYSVPWGSAINFDGPDSDHVRRFFCDNALMWLRDYHFDGLRIDAVHAIFDTSAVPFLEQLAVEVRELEARLGRQLVLIPESDLNDPRLLWSRERGGFGLHAQWSDDFHHSLHSVLTGERDGYYQDFGELDDLCSALREAFVYDGRHSAHRRRPHGRPAGDLSGHRFVACLQNHDQIGNRARGERTARLMSAGRLKIGAALLLTSPFVPLLFQGEDWGASTPFLYFTDHQEPDLSRAVREGRRKEFVAFGWNPADIPDPQAPETFQRSKLNWEELPQQPHSGLLDWHQHLIRLRRAEPALTDGRRDLVRTQHDGEARWLVVQRRDITVACNLLDKPQPVPISGGGHRILMASDQVESPVRGIVNLPPDSVVITKSEV